MRPYLLSRFWSNIDPDKEDSFLKDIALKNGANIYRDNEGRAPLFQEDFGHPGWYCLGGSTANLPTALGNTNNATIIDWDNLTTDEVGNYLPYDYARNPSWFNHDKFWWGFGPTNIGDSSGNGWFLDFEQIAPYVETRVGFHADPFIFDDLDIRYRRWYTAIENASTSMPHACRIPPVYNPANLIKLFESKQAFANESAKAKRAMWEAVGWLRWFGVISEGKQLPLPTLMSIIEVKQFGRAVGHAFDLGLDQYHINLPYLLHCGVPAWIRWGGNKALHLVRYNPFPYRIASSVKGEYALQERGMDLNIELTTSWDFDDFGQPSKSDSAPATAYSPHAVYLVIDFQGWGRRELVNASPAGIIAFLHLYQSSVETNTLGETHIVIYRWHPRFSSLPDPSHIEAINSIDIFEPMLAREMFRTYAPTESHAYDGEGRPF